MINETEIQGPPMPTEASVSLDERIARLKFDWDNQLEIPTPVFWLHGVGICSRGNLTVLTGQSKVGKSSFEGAMIASTMSASPVRDCLHVSSSNLAGKAVVHFDTEQSPAQHHAMMRGVVARAGLDAPPVWLHSYCFKGFSARDQRIMIERALATNWKRHEGVHSVFIDGVADLVTDPNRSDECIECVIWLECLAIHYNAPIVVVLHLNPVTSFMNGSKGRGHLGSQLERKVETEIRLRRDRDGATSVWTPLARAQPLPLEKAVRFKWDNRQGGHISTDDAQLSRLLSKAEKLLADAMQVPGLTTGISYGEFVARWSSIHGVSKKTAESKHAALKKLTLITRQGKEWLLCPSLVQNPIATTAAVAP